MNTTPVNTPYGIIYGRNALIMRSYEIVLSPFSIRIRCSLSLAACKPEILDLQSIEITLAFTELKNLCIYKIDEYPEEKYTSSSFDKVTNNKTNDRYILSTYDHVFDLTGKLESFCS